MRCRVRVVLSTVLGVGLSLPAAAQPAPDMPAAADTAEADVTADPPVTCVRQTVEAGVTIVRVTTGEQCVDSKVPRPAQASWRSAFQAPYYCHSQGTACSFELGADRTWPGVSPSL